MNEITDDTKVQEAEASTSTPSEENLAEGNQPTQVDPPSPEEGQKLIFGKYKNMDEAEKAFKSLEHNFHEKKTPEKAEEEVDISSLLGTPDAPSKDPLYPYGATYVDPNVQRLENVENKLKLRDIADTWKEVSKQPRFKDYEQEIVSEIKADPILMAGLKMGQAGVIKRAYDSVRARNIDQEIAEATTRTQKELESINATKPTVLGEGSTTPPPVATPAIKDKMKAAADANDWDAVMLDPRFAPKGLLK